MNKLILSVKTPTRVIVDKKEVDSVTLPAWEGQMTVLYNHAPCMVKLNEGIIKYREGEKEEYFAIFWGFAEVFNNEITVLAEDASLAEEIDSERLRQEYERLKEESLKKHDIEDIEIMLKKIVVDLRLSDIVKRKKSK